ncbi:Calmodulin [Clonorchis sinensis]|uniref:Calmodulin n=2 Tax=Clonorchis sinensis TaxID=79923 RepID=A0A8T1MX47_CLOSI|nr:Calmodulin [Clonorchis sinensis]
MVDTLSKSELEELQGAFAANDKDGNGSIDIKELEEALSRVGRRPTRFEVANIMRRFDSDGDGRINFPEFIVMVMKKKKFASVEADLRRAFNYFDKNGDGFISQDELRSVIRLFGDKLKNVDAEAIMNEADENGDGLLNYEEFLTLMGECYF